MDFVVGDVVVLRSGGPRMTISWVGSSGNGNRMTACQWFAGEARAGVLMDGNFHPAALELRRAAHGAHEETDDKEVPAKTSP